jgi:serine/threonine-protein kinase RsbW
MTEPKVLTARPMQRTFPGRADQIARAREFTKRVLGACPVTDEAVLLVSELATNALEHTSTGDGGQFQVTICRNGTSLLIGVSDSGSDKTPAPGPLDPESETGRGLGLVELIAERWGYCGDQHGLTVWFEVSTGPSAEQEGPGQPTLFY